MSPVIRENLNDCVMGPSAGGDTAMVAGRRPSTGPSTMAAPGGKMAAGGPEGGFGTQLPSRPAIQAVQKDPLNDTTYAARR